MNDLFSQLVLDHKNLVAVLQVLRSEIQHLTHSDELIERLPLILDILDYIQAYPETFHHPLEEAAFDVLINKELADPVIIQRIRLQHSTLEQFTKRLQEKMLLLANEQQISDGIIDSLQQFVDQQQEHLDTENKHIMPCMQTQLSEGDWWDIASMLTLHKDPLFNQPLKDQFTVLASRIIR
jgi:hemerythrin-like domain-containing protein